MSSRPSTLRDLYAELDRLDAEFSEIPREEVRAYWDDGQPDDSRVGQNFAARRAISEQIAPLNRDMENDLRDLFAERLAAEPNASVGWYEDTSFAARLYGSLTNTDWEHEDGSRFGCSFRAAGGIVSDLKHGEGQGDYLEFYCSSAEGVIDEEVAEALASRGWKGTAL